MMIEIFACQAVLELCIGEVCYGVNDDSDCWNREDGGEKWRFLRTMFPWT